MAVWRLFQPLRIRRFTTRVLQTAKYFKAIGLNRMTLLEPMALCLASDSSRF